MAARCKLQRPGYAPVCISAGRPLNPAANNRPHYAECSARTNVTIVVWSSLMAVIHGPLTGEIRWQEWGVVGKPYHRWPLVNYCDRQGSEIL